MHMCRLYICMMHIILNLVLDPDVCIYDAANFVTNGRKDGQADSRSWMKDAYIHDLMRDFFRTDGRTDRRTNKVIQ